MRLVSAESGHGGHDRAVGLISAACFEPAIGLATSLSSSVGASVGGDP